MPNKIRRVVAALPLAFVFSLTSPASAQSQSPPAQAAPPIQITPDPRVHLTPAQAATFFSAFTALAQQAHVALVAEDQPLYMTLTHSQAARLDLAPDGEPLSTLLPRLAAAYDYDVLPSDTLQPAGNPPPGTVFLLKKRYTDPADLPSVTAQECALALEETTRYAENFNPHLVLGFPDRSPAVRDLIYSLTPAQIAAMGDIHRGVPVASLSSVQQQEVQQFLLHLYVQTAITDLPSTLGAINRVSATDPRFSWRTFAQFNPTLARLYPRVNARLFGYEATLANGKPVFVTMSKPGQVKVQSEGGIKLSFAAQARNRQPGEPPTEAPPAEYQLAPDDMTDPTPLPPDAPAPAPPVSSSLGDILTRMNVQAAAPSGDGLKVTLPPYLAPKRATVFGEQAATPRQEVAALAQVYGLRVLTEDREQGRDRLRLTRLSPTPTLDMTALHDVVDQFLPDPLVRAYRMHPTYLSLLVSAVKQIRTAAEPKMRASKDGSVALSALSEQEGRAFAVVLMADALDSLAGLLTADPPRELTHFSDLRLSGGLHADQDGKKRLTLLLALPSPGDPATLQAGIGVGGMNYDPINHTF